MLRLAQTTNEELAIDELMASAHNLYIRLQLLDLNHTYIDDLSGNFVDGQVSIDAEADITRACDLTLFDPFGKVQIEPNSPQKTAIYIAHMIRVIYVITSPDRSQMYEIPVFTGPIDAVSRDDFYLKVKCLGKESLSLNALWRGKQFKKGQLKTYIIKYVLQKLLGETKFNLATDNAKIGDSMKLNRATIPWKMLKKLASGMGYALFYDGRGVVQMRKKSHTTTYVFKARNMTSVPDVTYDLKKTINAVEVIGKKKRRKTVGAKAVAQRTHKLSPWKLGRGNPVVPRYLWKQIKDTSIRSHREAAQVAKAELKRGLISGVDVKFDGLPNPRLEEWDPCSINTPDIQEGFIMKRFTIPLVAGDNASYGYLKKFAPKAQVKKKRDKGKRGSRHD